MLQIDDLTVHYPGFTGRYTLRAPGGALIAVVGPSGGGKSTLLNALAGFAPVAAGTAMLGESDLLALPPAARPLSILFQEHNLFPHLTAADNVGLGLDPRLKLDAAQRGEVREALAAVGLEGMADRLPPTLSGGQRQRVGLARALARRRPLLLLDEPFAALDPQLRADMIELVDTLRQASGMAVLMTIHTPGEVAGIADATVEVRDGRLRPEPQPISQVSSRAAATRS